MSETLERCAQRLREQHSLSQTELRQLAGLDYTRVGRFERGTSQPSGGALRRLADALEVASDCLLNGAASAAAKARFEDRELLKPFQEIEQMPDEDKNVAMKLLDAFLSKKQLQALAR